MIPLHYGTKLDWRLSNSCFIRFLLPNGWEKWEKYTKYTTWESVYSNFQWSTELLFVASLEPFNWIVLGCHIAFLVDSLVGPSASPVLTPTAIVDSAPKTYSEAFIENRSIGTLKFIHATINLRAFDDRGNWSQSPWTKWGLKYCFPSRGVGPRH